MNTIYDETTEHLSEELKVLNDEVTAALSKRRAWMDVHMTDFARYKVGEELFDRSTGRRLGVISKLYRYWADQNPTLDKSMDVEYEYETSHNCFDNTSRRYVWICNQAELQQDRARLADPVLWEDFFKK